MNNDKLWNRFDRKSPTLQADILAAMSKEGYRLVNHMNEHLEGRTGGPLVIWAGYEIVEIMQDYAGQWVVEIRPAKQL